eukprot:GHRR01001572.1.p1 GENE.GHRR01001572.1~~GHRR01001572.1.p1  ORF type:complete len:131 (+),score=55.12 GHRR01001572.1:176-568(+)
MASLASKSVAFPASAAVAPGRSRRSLTVVARKTAAKAAYICIDCGWIYDGREPFDKLPNSYRCPVCNAPKRRFRQTEASGKRSGSSSAARRSQDDGKFDEGDKNFFVIAAAGGAALLGALYFFLNSQTQL